MKAHKASIDIIFIIWFGMKCSHEFRIRSVVESTAFVVVFALALNRVYVVAVTTVLVLHISAIGHHAP